MQDKTIQIEDDGQNLIYFDDQCLKNLVVKMGFSELSVFFETGSQKVHIQIIEKLICEVANDFVSQMLDMGSQVALKCHKKTNQLTQEDLNFVLQQKFKMPTMQVIVQNTSNTIQVLVQNSHEQSQQQQK